MHLETTVFPCQNGEAQLSIGSQSAYIDKVDFPQANVFPLSGMAEQHQIGREMLRHGR